MGQEPEPTATGQEPSATPPAPPQGEPKTYDEEYVKGIRSEAAAYRKKASGLEARIEELEARDMSETQKLTQERDRLKSEVDPLRNENLRLRVAVDKKLPIDLIDRLRGDNEEALAADADKLLELFQPSGGASQQQPVAPSFDGGVMPPVSPPADPEQAHQDVLVAALTGRPIPQN